MKLSRTFGLIWNKMFDVDVSFLTCSLFFRYRFIVSFIYNGFQSDLSQIFWAVTPLYRNVLSMHFRTIPHYVLRMKLRHLLIVPLFSEPTVAILLGNLPSRAIKVVSSGSYVSSRAFKAASFNVKLNKDTKEHRTLVGCFKR